MERGQLGSRLGFILISAGCAIGIGNVWKFPWMVGQYGGAAFIIIYLIFLLLMGVPVMAMEFSVGRAAKKSPVKMFNKLEPKDTKWHLFGYVCVFGNFVLMMFYTTVAGWMLNYFVKMLKGEFTNVSGESVKESFDSMLASPGEMVGFMTIIVIGTAIVNSMELKSGIEKVSKVMMIALLIIMIILAVHSVLLEGGEEGLDFYLVPNLQRISDVGGFNVLVAAMNQAFFTLSLGIGAMSIFGSYIDKDKSLIKESFIISGLDTFVAVVSGLIIFPACFAYGIDPGQGPALIFVTIPNIFSSMPGGRIWGTLFFVFMTFAAFSTVIAVCENIVAQIMDLSGWSRKKSSIIGMSLVFILSLPCALGFNLLSGFKPFGNGTNFLDLEDFIVSNLLLPFGSIIFILFCTRKMGWGWENFLAECNEGDGIKIVDNGVIRFYMSFILPLIMFAILVIGIINFFK